MSFFIFAITMFIEIVKVYEEVVVKKMIKNVDQINGFHNTGLVTHRYNMFFC